tara:strand:+ start:365 stop:1000 length:636 start_codon:yes stop_codon:yes gene_type:complete
MSQLKLTADSGGGTVAIKGPASTTGNAAIELTLPGTASATLDTLGRSGNILQVKNAIKTDTASITSNTFTDISGLSISITPSSSSNKVLFRGYVSLGTEANTIMAVKIFRDSTEIGKSTADSTAANNSTATAAGLNISSVTSSVNNQMHQLQFEVLDSPSTTSAVTYKVQFAEISLYQYASVAVYVNRPYHGTNASRHGVISSVTAMEVAA